MEAFLQTTRRFETHLLPPRSPQANPVEDLRRELKEQVAACLERSPGALPAGCRRYFDRLTRKQALATAGLGLCFYLDLPSLSPAFKTCRPQWVKRVKHQEVNDLLSQPYSDAWDLGGLPRM